MDMGRRLVRFLGGDGGGLTFITPYHLESGSQVRNVGVRWSRGALELQDTLLGQRGALAVIVPLVRLAGAKPRGRSADLT